MFKTFAIVCIKCGRTYGCYQHSLVSYCENKKRFSMCQTSCIKGQAVKSSESGGMCRSCRSHHKKRRRVSLVAMLLVLLAGVAFADELFFQNWDVVSVIPTENFIQVTVKNPEPEGIKVVVSAVRPDGLILAYWYFDQKGNPQVFKLTNEGYKFDPENAKRCLDCHKTI